MKQIIMTLAIAASSLVAFAKDDVGTVNKIVQNSFNKEFSTAQEVKWTAGTDFYKASFVMNEQYITAFYSTGGELLAMTRNISFVNMPLKLQKEVRADYSEYWISDLFELSDSDGTHYVITLEKADSKIVLKSVDNTEWGVFKKTTKL